MPLPSALSGAELTALNAGNDVTPYDLYYMPDTEVGHATVDGTPTAPIIEIAVASASAGWTNGKKDQTVKITNAGGTVLRGYYRLRLAPDSNSLFIEEINTGDPGLITIAARTTAITDGDLCTILDRYDIYPVKPFVSEGVIYQDRAIAIADHHNFPDDIVNVTINGQPGHYGTTVALAGTKAITAVVAVTKWPYSSGSTLTYQWTYPASFTGVSGATTATLTATAPVGKHWIRCTVTDSISGDVEIARAIMIADSANPPVRCNITRDLRMRDNGRKITVRLVNSRTSEIPAGALCVLTGAQTWGGSDVVSAAHSMAGFFYTQPYMTRPGDWETTADILSPAHILEMTNCYAAAFNYNGTADSWEHLLPNATTIPFVIWWVLRWRCANVLRLFNFTNPNTVGDTQKRRSISVDPGKVWPQLKTLADSINMGLACRSDGEIMLAYDPSYLEDRTGVITRGTLTNSIYSDISIEWNRISARTPVLISGYVADLNGSQDIQLSSEAPDELTGAKTFGNLVFENQADANQKSGRYYAHLKENAEFGRVTMTIPSNWDVIEPADMQRWTIQVPANRSPTSAAIELTGIPTQVQKLWIRGKRAASSVDFEIETDGTAGITIVVPPADTSMYGQYSNSFDTPISDVPGTWGDETTVVPSDNEKGLILLTLDGFVARGTAWGDMSPTDDQRQSGGTFIKMIADPYEYKSLILYANQSSLFSADGTSTSVGWIPTDLSASFNAGSDSWTHTFDFTVSDGGWVASTDPQLRALYVAGQGWHKSAPTRNDRVTILSSWTPGGAFQSATVRVSSCTLITNIGIQDQAYAACSGGETTVSLTSSYGSGFIDVVMDSSVDPYIRSITFTGTGANPFGGSSGGGGTDEVFISDITGSPNRKGWFAWLSKKTVSGTDYVYVNTTRNYFQSVATSVQVAAYVATMNYSISMSSYNSGATGVGFVSAGDPGGADCKVYKTTNWFSSVAAYATLNDSGGALSVPYAKGGGTANAGTSPQIFYVKGVSTNLQDVALDTTTNTLHAGATPVLVSRQAIQTFTLDGNYIFAVLDDGTFLSSSDGGATWTTKTSVPMTGSYVVGLNGSPQNKNFCICYGDQTLAITDDGGTTWTDLWSAYDTFRSGAYSAGGTVIVTAMADLGYLYSKAVTS